MYLRKEERQRRETVRLAVKLNHFWTSGTRDFDTSGTTVNTPPALQNYNNIDHLRLSTPLPFTAVSLTMDIPVKEYTPPQR